MGKIDELAKNIADQLSDKEIDKFINSLRNKKHNPIKWTDNNSLIKEYSISSGKKWSKLKLAKNNLTEQSYLRLMKPGQNLDIKSESEFSKIMTFLKTGAINLNWYNAEDVEILQNLDDYITKNANNVEKISKLRNTVSGLRERMLTMDVSQFENSLDEFKKLYTNQHEEKDLQDFLKNNAWILGDEYVYQQPIFFSQFPMWTDKLDFFVKRYDGHYDIIEIKKADVKLFTGLSNTDYLSSPSRTSTMTADLKDAISQIINYLEESNTFRQAIREIRPEIHIFKPRGFIILGRNDSQYQDAIATINSYLNNIEILTYDHLYDKAKGFITRIKKGNN